MDDSQNANPQGGNQPAPNAYDKPKTSEQMLEELRANPDYQPKEEEQEGYQKPEEQEEEDLQDDDSNEEEDSDKDQEEDSEDEEQPKDDKKKKDEEPDEDEEKELEADDLFEPDQEQPKEEEEEDLDPETKKIVDSRIQKLAGTKLQQIDEMKRDVAFDKFIGSKEGEIYQPYAEEIKKWIHDPKLKTFKFEAIANMVAGRRLIKLGAERYKKALTKSQKSKTGGNTPRKPSERQDTMPDVGSMKSDEVQAMAERVKRGTFGRN